MGKDYDAIVSKHMIDRIKNFDRYDEQNDSVLESLKQFNDNTVQLLKYLQNEYLECYNMCIKYNISDYNILDFASVINPTCQYVYFIRNKTTGLTKIGRTKELKRRLSEIKRAALQCGVPFQEVEYIGIIFCCGENADVECYAHKLFNDYRRIGEWFELSDEQVSNFIYDYSDYGIFTINPQSDILIGISGFSDDEIYGEGNNFDNIQKIYSQDLYHNCKLVVEYCNKIIQLHTLVDTINHDSKNHTVVDSFNGCMATKVLERIRKDYIN